jgi:flagellar motor switch/type III secretory pathway protein FliN
MPARAVTEFPWAALDRLDRAVENTLRSGRRWLGLGAHPRAFAAALTAILGTEVTLFVRSIDARQPAASLVRLGFARAQGRGDCVVGLEPALAFALLAKLLRRPVPLVRSQSDLDPTLLGALSALLAEGARRSGASEAVAPVEAAIAPGSAVVHVTAIVDGRPYQAALWMPPAPPLTPEPERALGELGALELALPLIVAVNAIAPGDLTALTPGAGWCPGSGWLVDGKLEGRGILAAGASERGLAVDLGPGARIVLRQPTTTPLVTRDSMAQSDDSVEPTTLPQAVLDAPVVVRVELGMVSMKAREWAALQPGDVIETGRRIAEPVALRAGGRLLARGELVNVEGELGVRVTEILPEGSS